MSKILEQETQFTDIDMIRQSLEQLGYEAIYNHDYSLQTMKGYSGTTFQANVGVTKANFEKVTGVHTFGDLGFRLNADRSIGMTADDLLVGSSSFTPILDGLKVKYAENVYTKIHQQAGFGLEGERQVLQDGTVVLSYVQQGTI